MKRIVLAVALLLVPAFLFADSARRPFLVGTRGPARIAMRGLINDDATLGVDRREHRAEALDIVDAFSAQLTDAEAEQLRRSPQVRYVEEDVLRRAFSLPMHPGSNELRDTSGQTVPYGVKLVDAVPTWPVTRGAGVNVAVLDTGIDLNHTDLKAAYQGGFNTYAGTFGGEGNDPVDDHGHGTHVSGTIAATNDSAGVVGVASAAKLWSVRVLKSDGAGGASGSASNIARGIQWVVQQKASLGGNWIISMSLGSCSDSKTERDAVTAAINAGVLVVAAAGNHDPSSPDICGGANDNSYSVSYPAAYPNVLAIAAVDSSSNIADFSNFGPEVLLAAPGVDVLSTMRLGTATLTFMKNGSSLVGGAALTGSPKGDVTNTFVDCGLGKPGEFPAAVNGKIALIKRGDTTFNEKVRNAVTAGAKAVVIYNKDTSALSFTLIGQNCDSTGKNCTDKPEDLSFAWPLTVAITQADGEALLQTPSAAINVVSQADDYGSLSGTSMACPHVAAVAALAWSVAPTATATAIRQALTSTAHDLGTPGVDTLFGYGLVDAYAAAKQLAPALFNPNANPTGDYSGRKILRRGGH
jgi:serine protease